MRFSKSVMSCKLTKWLLVAKLLIDVWPAAHDISSEEVVNVNMTSLVDSEAHFRKRAEEMAMSDRGVRALVARGITTLGKLAFAHGCSDSFR